jgi:hypothetical protein
MTSDDSKPFPPRRTRSAPPVIDGEPKAISEPVANEPVAVTRIDPIEAQVVPDVPPVSDQIGLGEPASAIVETGPQPVHEAAAHGVADATAETIAPAAFRTQDSAPPPQARPRSLASLFASLAGLAALAVAGLVWFGQRGDSGSMAALESRAASLEQKLDALDKRVGAAEASLQKSNATSADLTRGLAAVDASAKSAVLAAEAARSDAAKATQNDAVAVDLHPLEQRITDVETLIKSPKMEGKAVADRIASPPPGELPGNAAGLVVIGHALVDAVSAGEPFQTQLNAAESLGADPVHTTILKPFAVKGVASLSTLGQQFLPIANRLATSDPSGHPADSLIDRAMGAVQRLVKVRTIGEPVGDDANALAAQIAFALKQGDGGKASAVWERLPASAKSLSQTWFNDLKTVNDVQSAARAIVSDAIAALGKPKS